MKIIGEDTLTGVGIVAGILALYPNLKTVLIELYSSFDILDFKVIGKTKDRYGSLELSFQFPEAPAFSSLEELDEFLGEAGLLPWVEQRVVGMLQKALMVWQSTGILKNEGANLSDLFQLFCEGVGVAALLYWLGNTEEPLKVRPRSWVSAQHQSSLETEFLLREIKNYDIGMDIGQLDFSGACILAELGEVQNFADFTSPLGMGVINHGEPCKVMCALG